MTLVILLVAAFLLVTLCVALYVIFSSMGKSGNYKKNLEVSTSLRSLVAAQRVQPDDLPKEDHRLTLAAAQETGMDYKQISKTYKLDLARKLSYADLSLTVVQVRLIQGVLAALLAVILMLMRSNNYPLALMSMLWAPMFVGDVVTHRMNKRTKHFDQDYASFLMSYVSLLKTGLNTLAALEMAAKGLDDHSLVKAEIGLLIERIKLGLPEEQAIGSFGETIYHPEIELFVQSLTLSRKLGGNLSGTLERLAKQVRKRGQFKSQANAAVGMERGSAYAILIIMIVMVSYLYKVAPDLMSPAFFDPMGWIGTQFCIFLVFCGIYVMRKITNIKV